MRAKTFKPCNALIALLAALALCFCAACSSDEDDDGGSTSTPVGISASALDGISCTSSVSVYNTPVPPHV